MQLIQSIFNNAINEWEIFRLPHSSWPEHPDVNPAKPVTFDLQAGRVKVNKTVISNTHTHINTMIILTDELNVQIFPHQYYARSVMKPLPLSARLRC